MTTNTKFASAERGTTRDIECDFEELSRHSCSKYFDFFPLPLLVLNAQRQVIFSNQAFSQLLDLKDVSDFLGQRPGEALQCAYAGVESGGCGTSEFCRECGALHAILESMNTDACATHDCQLLQAVDGGSHALDLRVHASPFCFKDSKFYVLTIKDISDEKRREAMERVFFHDILNSAGSAKSLVEILNEDIQGKLKEPMRLLEMSLYGLVEEIQTHKELRMAEKGDYPLSPMTIQSLEIVEGVANEFRSHQLASRRSIGLIPDSANAAVKVDYSLLRRVLVNMLKNALEATPHGGSVAIGCRSEGGYAVFEVRNDQVMPRSVQLQVFKRSFSTKGMGRGLGTYSIKMLTENFLGGKAEFESAEGIGTVFRIRLPRRLQETVCS